MEATDAITGPGALVKLLQDFALAPDGTTIQTGIAQWPDDPRLLLVLVAVGKGPKVAMSPLIARSLAHYCLATELMPPILRGAYAAHLATLAHRLIELAGEAEAMAPHRLH